MESFGVADDRVYEMDQSCSRVDGPGGGNPAAEMEGNLSQLLDRRQQLEVCDAVCLCFNDKRTNLIFREWTWTLLACLIQDH